jgi:oligoendopeptidase F
VPDYIAHEWAFIPHFYLNFYVFQYATSFTASEALASKVLAGDPAATKRTSRSCRRRLEIPHRLCSRTPAWT